MTSALETKRLRTWLPELLLLTGLLVVFRDTVAAMVTIWIQSPTFQHAFLVVPITAWLVWRRRSELAVTPTRPVPWLLLPMVAVCFLWLLGELAEVAAASQLSVVTLLVLSVPAMFGWQLARVLTFPLAFLYFCVPFGEFAVPYLQQWTADVTVVALRATGIPVYREGMQFVIPSGSWSVVEACSGIRYLIACVMVGTLFAYLNYRSPRRRAIFMVAALIVPVFANWIRAYTIVMIGHLTGSPMILGVEHTTYGWVLFGFVVALMFWVGARWSEPTGTTSNPPRSASGLPPPGQRSSWAVACAVMALAVGAHAWACRLEGAAPTEVPSLIMPEGGAGWRADASRMAPRWTPGYANPSISAFRSYAANGTVVDVWIGFYRAQNKNRKLVSSTHGILSNEGRTWRAQSTGVRPASPAVPAFSTSVVSEGLAPNLSTTRRDRVWQVYWLNGRWIVRASEAKLWQAWDRLLGHGDDGAVLLVVTAMADDADAVLEEFARTNLADIGRALDAAKQAR